METYSDKIMVITGASSGIGASSARYFAQFVAKIVLLARREEKLTALCQELNDQHQNISSYWVCDVSNREQVKDVFKQILETHGKIDILINNAGYGIFGQTDQTSVEAIERITQVNYLGSVYCTKAVLTHMLERGSGSIIAVSSVVGILGFPNFAAYAGTKFAQRGFFMALYHELKPHGIHVGIIYPSGTQTEFFEHPSFKKRSDVRLYRLQTPEAVVKAIDRSIRYKSPELIRPRYMRLAVYMIDTFKIVFRPLIAKLNPGDNSV